MAYIFQNKRVGRFEIYDFILNTLIAAGWKNISSNRADGDVMYSTGIDGNREIYLHFLPYYILTEANIWSMTEQRYTADHIQTKTAGNLNFISYSLPLSYVPGVSGASGKFNRDFTKGMMFVSTISNGGSADLNQTYDVWYYVDKNKLILSIKAARYYTDEQAQFFYLGQPDTLYVTGNDTRNTIMAAAEFVGYRSNAGTSNVAASGIYLADYPSKYMGSKADGYCMATYKIMIPTATPNSEGIYILSEPYIDVNECGVCSKLDGIYLLPSDTKYNYGDVIKIGAYEFFVVGANNNLTGHVGAFNCPIAFQIK